MKKLLTATAAAALLIGTAAGGMAQTAPGQQMKEKGSVSGSAGASGYAPGQQMQQKGSVSGTTGASGYAPGQNKDSATTGANVKGGAELKAPGGSANTDVKSDTKIK